MGYLLYHFTPDEFNLMKQLNNIISTISLCALICFFIMFFHTPTPRPLYNKCVANLMIAGLIYVLANFLINLEADDLYCIISGVLREAGIWLSLYWSALIGYISYSFTVNNKILTPYFPVMVSIGYLSAGLFAGLPLTQIFGLYYGPSIFYCWISVYPLTERSDLILNILMLFLQIWVVFFLTVYWYTQTYFYLRSLPPPFNTASFKRLFLYPLMVVIAFLPATIDYFLLTEHSFFIVALHVCTQNSLALLNAVAFFIHRILIPKTDSSRRPTAIDEVRSNHTSFITSLTEREISISETNKSNSAIEMRDQSNSSFSESLKNDLGAWITQGNVN